MTKRIGTFAAAVALVASAFAATPIFAAQSSSTLTVNGSVSQSCTTLSSDQTLTFSAYDSFQNASNPVNGTEVDFTTKCTKGAAGVNFSVDGGKNCAATGVVSGDRAMKSGTSNYLSYQLYQDSNHTTAWPFTAGTCAANAGPTLTIGSSQDTQTLKIFGQIPGGQDPNTASDYTDSVTVAINY